MQAQGGLTAISPTKEGTLKHKYQAKSHDGAPSQGESHSKIPGKHNSTKNVATNSVSRPPFCAPLHSQMQMLILSKY